MADKEDVLALLRIADLAKEWPNLRPIHDHAMAALDKISKEHAEQQAKAKAQEEADKLKAAAEEEKAKSGGGKKEDDDDEKGVSPRPLSRTPGR